MGCETACIMDELDVAALSTDDTLGAGAGTPELVVLGVGVADDTGAISEAGDAGPGI